MTATLAIDEIDVADSPVVEKKKWFECTELELVDAAAGLDPLQSPEHEHEAVGAGRLLQHFPAFAYAAPSFHSVVALPGLAGLKNMLEHCALLALERLVDPAVGSDATIRVQQDPANCDRHDQEVEAVGDADTATALENLHPSWYRGNTAFVAEAACLA